MAQGTYMELTEDTEIAILCASDIEILVGSDNHKAKGGGTVSLLFKQHEGADWSTVKVFSPDDIIEDFKANSVYGGKYKLSLDGASGADLQVSWRM